MASAVMSGYQRKLRGEQHHSARLTEADVRELRRLVEKVGVCSTCAAKVLGLTVHRATIHDAITYVTWRHVR